MTDPEERRGPGTGGSDPEVPLDDFERIVASWRREGQVPQWPSDPPTPDADGPVADPPASGSHDSESHGSDSPGSGSRRSDSPGSDSPATDPFDSWESAFGSSAAPAEPAARPPARREPLTDDAADPDEHFVPPEPPPLPRLGPPAFVGLALLGLGLLLVIAPSVLGMSSVYGLPLGLLALAAGLGWLVLRLWPTPMDDEPDLDDDDGAVL